MGQARLLLIASAAAMLAATVGSILTAEWQPNQFPALWAAVFGLLAGVALAHSSFSPLAAHLTSLNYGAFAVAVICGTQPEIAAEGEWRFRIAALAQAVAAWVRNLTDGEPSRYEPIVHLFVLSSLFWLLGYSTAWQMLRHRQVWHGILPVGITLFSNVYYYAGPRSMTAFLGLFLLGAVLALAGSHLANQQEDWSLQAARLPMPLTLWITGSSLLLTIGAGLIGGWFNALAQPLSQQDTLEPLRRAYERVMDRWRQLFAAPPEPASERVDRYTDSLSLGGPRSLPPDPVMDVSAPLGRYYWRATSFDEYDGRVWRNTLDTVTSLPGGNASIPVVAYAERAIVQADFSLYRSSDSLFTPSQPLRATLDTQALFERAEGGLVNLVQLRLPVLAQPGTRYRALGSVSTASQAELRAALGTYPEWVRQRYLQLPSVVPDRVRDLAENITQDAPTAFDKAVAIERWLRRNIEYDDQASAPPLGVEASEYVLFETRRAYCDYYATAMVVMLRTLGIPSRIAVGYSQGRLTVPADDNGRALYHVRVDDAHAWVEVFFPDYGWVEFEPTANQPSLERPEAQPTPTPIPPTPTPEPVATPTPVLQVSPTPAPNPTATPAVTLPQPPAPPPPLAQGIQAVLGALLALTMSTLFLVGMAWVGLNFAEQAGLWRLSPVERAYGILSRYAHWLRVCRAGDTPTE
ncbi:MAG: DUF3488 and transglutaminase-like domain-containing protein, partial [Thermoflexales bacterium]|nr:DUF3488 and transglutaminase-like domain-containing protein [Thermoflexales bacterium]